MLLGILTTRSLVPNLISEVLVRILLVLLVFTMHVSIQPHVQYLTEADLNNYKKPRKESLVPPSVMIVLIIFVPLILFSLPWLLARDHLDTTQTLLAWTLALAINALITETVKLIVGRPRPDFFHRCFPKGAATRGMQYTGSLTEIMEGRKSFPSGHSSFSFCSLGFLSLWLCGRLGVLSRKRGNAYRILTCLLPSVLATIIAVSRWLDNHHHWEDVTVGSLIGMVTSYVCYGQYYFPLNSNLSGYPYALTQIARESEYFVATTECCTRQDDCCTNMLRLRDNSLGYNQKVE